MGFWQTIVIINIIEWYDLRIFWINKNKDLAIGIADNWIPGKMVGI
jgi:hypothetical protein